MISTVSSTTQLQNYGGAVRSILVTDTETGGVFNYSEDALTPDGENIFAATGVGEGYWVRLPENYNGVIHTNAIEETKEGTLNIEGDLNISKLGAASKIFFRRGLDGALGSYIGNINQDNPINFVINSGGGGSYLSMRINGVEVGRFAPDTGNFLIGGTTDNASDKLQVTGTSISSGNSYAPNFSSLKGKQWNIFGDSFSNDIPNDYVGIVRDNLGLIATTNAVSGAKLSEQLAVAKAFVAGSPTYFTTFDIVTLHIGVNDFANDLIPLGTPLSTIGDGTFAGDLKDFIQVILTSNPKVKLYIITPPEANGAGVLYKAVNSEGWSIKDLSVLISSVCLDYSIQCIDLYSMSGFNLQTIPTYTSDLLHPNSDGRRKLADIVSQAFQGNNSKGRTGNYEDLLHTTGNESKVGNLSLTGILASQVRTFGTAGSPVYDDVITYSQARIKFGNEATNNFGKSISFWTVPIGVNTAHEALRLNYDKTSTFFEKVTMPTAHVGSGTPLAGTLLDIGASTLVSGAIIPIVSITRSVDNIQCLQLQNKSTGTSAEMRFITAANDNSYFAFTQPSSNNSSTGFFGVAKSSGSFIINSANGATARDIYLGTLDAKGLFFGTNNTVKMAISSAGVITLQNSATLEVPTPTTNSQAANKSYVDTLVASQVVTNLSITTAQSASDLNTLYPTATEGLMVICPNVGIGGAREYIKTSETGQWSEKIITILNP